MIVDPAVLPGLLLLAAELAVLAAVGFVVVRVALRQNDDWSALAQGLVAGPALWGIVVNFVMSVVPGLAGAAVGWVVLMGSAGLLAWRSSDRLGVSARTLAGFAGAVLVLGWAALASRQLVGIANPYVDLGLAATIRAGAFPVSLPWHPQATEMYHYGASLLVGLLAPPGGPDLAFAWELLGAYAWVSFALVVVTAMRRRGSWLMSLLLAPLLLSYGLHTFFPSDPDKVAGLLAVPLPAGLPAAGLRAGLADIYWTHVEPDGSRLVSLPDIWKPAFPLGYGVAFVVLAQAARPDRPTWPGSLTLAGLVGFLGLLVTTLAPVVALLWGGLEAMRLLLARRTGMATRAPALRAGAGLAVAGLLLVFGGGALSGIVSGGTGSAGLAWTSGLDANHWAVLGGFEAGHGGAGLLRLGPVAVAGLAAAFGRRDRMVLTLAAGAGLFALAWLALDYPARTQDLDRLAGHARNVALVALLLALSECLAGLRIRRQRYAAVMLLLGLVIWPTVAAPARSLAGALGHGVQFANADWAWRAARENDESVSLRRHAMPEMSRRVAAFIQDHTAAEARVLDPTTRLAVLLHTGRPNNYGFTDTVQLSPQQGPEYLDARHYLEPAALRQLSLSYVYATDDWVASLPDRARRWLADPSLFDLLTRDGDEALYYARPEFLALTTAPHPESFEALRAAVSPATVVYLQPQTRSQLQVDLLRVASSLPQARLVGIVNPERLHLRTPVPWRVEPLGEQALDLVALPTLHEAWLYPPAGWRQIWRNPTGRAPSTRPRSLARRCLLPNRSRSPSVWPAYTSPTND